MYKHKQVECGDAAGFYSNKSGALSEQVEPGVTPPDWSERKPAATPYGYELKLQNE